MNSFGDRGWLVTRKYGEATLCRLVVALSSRLLERKRNAWKIRMIEKEGKVRIAVAWRSIRTLWCSSVLWIFCDKPRHRGAKSWTNTFDPIGQSSGCNTPARLVSTIPIETGFISPWKVPTEQLFQLQVPHHVNRALLASKGNHQIDKRQAEFLLQYPTSDVLQLGSHFPKIRNRAPTPVRQEEK